MSTGEDHGERLDRELLELLNELRVMIPGVQVLFAFLLTAPFSQRFTVLNQGNKNLFFVAVLCTAGATAALLAVPNYHRVMFRAFDKERLLRTANRLAVAGSALLAMAIVAALSVLTDLLYDGLLVVAVPVVAAVVLGGLWFALPGVRRARRRAGAPPGSADGSPAAGHGDGHRDVRLAGHLDDGEHGRRGPGDL